MRRIYFPPAYSGCVPTIIFYAFVAYYFFFLCDFKSLVMTYWRFWAFGVIGMGLVMVIEQCVNFIFSRLFSSLIQSVSSSAHFLFHSIFSGFLTFISLRALRIVMIPSEMLVKIKESSDNLNGREATWLLIIFLVFGVSFWIVIGLLIEKVKRIKHPYVEVAIGLKCPYCKLEIEPNDKTLSCKHCEVLYHAKCMTTIGLCSVPGCKGARSLP